MALSFFQQLQRRNRDFEIEINERLLPVKVRENNRAKRMIMRIESGGGAVNVTIPAHVGDEAIEAFVVNNRNWIAGRLDKMPEKITVVEGSLIPYLGQDHQIVSTRTLRGVVEVSVIDGKPVLLIPGESFNMGKKILTWYKRQARQELDRAVLHHCGIINVRPKRIRITDTTSRWGSCSSTRTLSFSWRIVMAPPGVLNYLAAHEVAHLVEMNHSARFWTLVKKLCPETDRHKNWLRTHGTKLHAIDLR